MLRENNEKQINHITHLINMFEAKLGEASPLKKIERAMKNLVIDAPFEFDCTEHGTRIFWGLM